MTSDNEGFSAPGLPVQVGPMDVQQKEFRVSRLGGYKMRDVDEFLDEITTSMTSLLAENERLRANAGASPVLGSPDLDDVARQADEIIQRARDEAAQILADARAGAVTAAVLGAEGDRGAVKAFLVQEREFLQGLAALVQGHADSVKGMAKAARSVAPPADPTASATEAAGVTVDEERAPAVEDEAPEGSVPVTEQHAAERAAESQREPEPEAEVVTEVEVVDDTTDEDRTIRIDDPQPATASSEPEDGSLRELFWGEED